MIRINLLQDGGQSAASVAGEIASFLSAAKQTLELALYDVHLESENAAPIRAALAEALARNVAVRLAYNVDFGKAIAVPPPPTAKPELVEALPVETRAIPGVPDLMHHKYVVRDGETVLDRLDQLDRRLLDARGEPDRDRPLEGARRPLPRRTSRSCGRGATSPAPATSTRPRSRSTAIGVRPWFSPGHGEALAHRIARRLGQAKRRIRIASPVLTSGPILGTLAELSTNNSQNRPDIAGVLDATQIAEVIGQWREKP